MPAEHEHDMPTLAEDQKAPEKTGGPAGRDQGEDQPAAGPGEQALGEQVPEEQPEEQVDELSALRQALTEKSAEAESYFNRLQRLQADFENFRRRSRREQEELISYAAEGLITDLLPVIDNLERALQAGTQGGELASFLEGIQMIYRQFWGVLEKRGLSPVAAVGEAFDPERHHAVMQVETEEYAENTVVEELQKGYRLKDKVIRPSLVKVAKSK